MPFLPEVVDPAVIAQRAVWRRPRQIAAWLSMLALLGAAPQPQAVAATSATPATPAVPATDAKDRAALEKQLDAARARLDDAARDVADLTQQLHGDAGDDVMRFLHGGARGAMLGVNIGGEQKRDDGVELMGVSPGGPAEVAGLRKGDVLVAVDGKPLRRTGDVSPSRQLVDYLRSAKPEQVVKLDYVRDGKKQVATVTTGEAEPPMARMLREHLPGGMVPPGFEDFVGHHRAFGSLELVPVTPKLGQYFGTDKGLLVVRAPTTPGAKLEEGDVILTIDGRTPENARHAFRILGSYQPQEKLKVEVMRQRKRMTLDVQMPDTPMEGPGFGPRAPMPPVPPVPPAGPGSKADTTSS